MEDTAIFIEENKAKVHKAKQEAQDKFKETTDEIQKKAENFASDIKNAKQEEQNKLKEILSKGKQETQDKIKKTKDEIQTKAQEILEEKNDGEVQTFWNKIKDYGKKIFNFGGSINRSPSLYSTTKQHYLNLKSMY